MTRPDPGSNAAPGSTPLMIEKVVGGGRALAHHDGETWLVEGALPGESIDAEVQRRRAGIVEASATRIIDGHHPSRDAQPCPHATECGGCDWPHVDPDSGSALKVSAAAEAVRGAPDLAERLRSAQIHTSPSAYRLRARLHWEPVTSRLGFYESRSWRVVAIPSCRVVSPLLSRSLAALGHALENRCPTPVDLEWLEDLSGENAVAALRPAREGPQQLEPAWLPELGEIEGVVDGFHMLSHSGERSLGWGAMSVSMALPVSISVPIGSFFQVNRHLAGWLFDRVVDVIGSRPVPTWDLHAGVGYLAAAAHHAAERRLQLVEPFETSARAARRNLPSARVAAGWTAEAYLDQVSSLPEEALVLTDPPRAGMTPELRQQLADWHPERILMLACDPATWGRDARFLTDRGYRLTHVELVDLFPSTHHVEILAVLESG